MDLAVAVAGRFNLSVFTISLLDPHLDDNTLMELFQELPGASLVLLEDIDSAGLGREVSGETQEDGEKKKKRTRARGGVTLSGLLNCLDGAAAPEGHLLFMSTNAPEALDEALIRAGRIDVRVEFKFADSDQIRQIFTSMYKPRTRSVEDLNEVDQQREDENAEKELAGVNTLAEKFVKLVPEYQFSPAQLQGYFLLHKTSAQSAVDNVEKWICDEVQRKFEQEAQAQAQTQASKTESKQKPKLSKKRATNTGKTNPTMTQTAVFPSIPAAAVPLEGLSPVAQQSMAHEHRQEPPLPMRMTLTSCGDEDNFYTPPSSPTTSSSPSHGIFLTFHSFCIRSFWIIFSALFRRRLCHYSLERIRGQR